LSALLVYTIRRKMDIALFIGRLLFAALFIASGIAHFKSLEAMTGYAKYKKLPAPKLGVIGSGLFFLVGGIYILLGLWIDLGALLIAITVILAALIFHQYWKESDANTKMQEMTAFNKDLALGGAAIIILALVAGGVVSGDEFGPHVGNISFFNR
jgi:uncharacterized membrane protein YphA (DoxX/SURF4 family)